MRGADVHQEGLFSYLSPESRIPKRHPLRPIRSMVDRALGDLCGEFEAMYASAGRPSIAPEKLLRALLLQIFYSIRSERMLCEQLDYNLLFRWFIGLSMDDAVWDHSTFSKNRDRLLESDMARRFFDAVLAQAEAEGLTSDEHFTVDGTLIEAWASLKSVRKKDGSDEPPPGGGRNPDRHFHGEKRSNQTHASSTDPEAQLFRKGKSREARLYYLGHVLMENRHGLVVDGTLTPANGFAERDQALAMVARRPGQHRITLAADKLYDTKDFVAGLRELTVTPHVAQNITNRRSAIDGRTTRHDGYAVSQKVRKRVEEIMGWGKDIGPVRKTKLRGANKVGFQWLLTLSGYNLVRMRNILAEAPT
jgi:transposase